MKTKCSTSPVVTVVDPRHPLFGRTFPLVRTFKTQKGRAFCIVELKSEKTRQIPLEVTDKSEIPISINDAPIDIKHLLKLCNTYFNCFDNGEDSSTQT